MIAVECPQCGAPTPAFPLAPERIHCRGCRYQGPPRPEVVEQIRAAAQQLGAAQAQHARHLSAAQARVLTSLLRNRKALHWVLILLLVPLGSCAGCSVLMVGVEDPELGLALIFGLPLVFFATAAFLASRKLSAQVRELSDACAAVPPAAPGAPAQCHLCGGPLPPATHASPIVRCGHCGADNIAGHEVLADVVQRRSWVVGQYGQTLARRGAVLAVQGSGAVAMVLLAGLVAPIAGCVTAFLIETNLDDVPLAPVDDTYALVSAKGATCVARILEPTTPGRVRLEANGGWGGPTTQSFADGPHVRRLPPSWFVGQWLRSGFDGNPGKGVAREVYINLLRPRRNKVRLVDETGTETTQVLDGSCFLVPASPPPTVVWELFPAPGASASTPTASTPTSAGKPGGR